MFIKSLNIRPRKVVAGAFLALSLWASAGINLKTNSDSRLSEVISAIRSQSDYQFFYDDAMASHKVKPATLRDADVKDALDKLLQGTGISYTIKDKIIYLKVEREERPAAKKDQAKRTVKGQLLDENGDPLIGASVLVKGQNTGVATDMDGNYIIEVSGDNPELAFSYIGYKSKTVKVGDNTSLETSLIPDSNTLDEIVVTALGIKREKKMLGYSVQDVKGADLNTTGDPSVIGALDGKVAGLQMNTASTGLGGSTKITIRGNHLQPHRQPRPQRIHRG